MSITRPTSTSYKSQKTGKIYQFVNDPDGSSRRAALTQLEADDRGADAQPKRPPAPAPIRDTRAPRDRFAQRIEEANLPENQREPKVLDTAAGLNARLEQLRRDADTALTPVARAKIKRRIGVLENRLAAYGETEAAKAQRAALFASDDYKRAETEATATVSAVDLRIDLDQSYLDDARANLANLKATGDVDQYTAAHGRLKERFDAYQATKLSELKAAELAIQGQISVFKSAENLDPSATRPNPGGAKSVMHFHELLSRPDEN